MGAMDDATPPIPPAPISGVIPIPIHSVAGHLRVRRPPGRPRRPALRPDADAVAWQDAVVAARDRHVESDAVVAAAELRDRSAELLNAVIVGIATETASLDWEIRHIGDARDIERARSRRVDGLLALARLVLERDKLQAGEIPPGKMARIVEMLVSKVEGIAREVLPAEKADEVMARYRAEVTRARG